MATYRLYPATNGAPNSQNFVTSDYIVGLSFKVTSAGLFHQGFWWWVADANQYAGPTDFALWVVNGTASGTYVPGSKTTSGPLSVGWNFVRANNQLALTLGQEYRAVTHTEGGTWQPLNGYATTLQDFTAGGTHQAGVTNGPLYAFCSALGTGTVEPADSEQMTAYNGGTDVTSATSYPTAGVNSNVWLDIQVGTGALAGGGKMTYGFLAAMS